MGKIFKAVLPYALCVVLSVALYHKWSAPLPPVPHAGIMETVAKAAKEYRDKEDRRHIAIDKNANAISVKDLNTVKIGIVDTASHALKIARTEIDQITKAKFVIEQKYLAAVKVIDSLGQMMYAYEGKYLKALYNPQPSDQYPQGYFNYKYDGEFNIVDYTKETKFLGMKLKKKSYTDFYFSDTAAYLTGNIKRVTIEKAQAEKIFKINAASRYNVQSEVFGYGPGFQIEKGAFDMSVNQIYFPSLNKWSTIFNANITLKGF